MEITWFGHACFRIKGKDAVLVTDPCSADMGYPMKNVSARIVTLSHAHDGHGHPEVVGNGPRVLKGPGEYEIGDVFIIGVNTFHDSSHGAERGKNTIYLIEMDDIRILHLGDLGHALSPSQVEELGKVDVVMVPVGGVSTIGAKTAREIVLLLGAKIVIPMHFQTKASSWLEPVNLFLKEMGLGNLAPQTKLVVTRSNIPSEMQVLLLEHSAQAGEATPTTTA